MPEPLSPEGKIPSPKTADDINDLFKELDTEQPKERREPKELKEPKREVKETEEDVEKLDEDDLELKDPEEETEKLDLAKPEDFDIEAPPRKQEILKEYPELFKKFPFLEKMLYRDKQYTELFGSYDDAKEIAERSESFTEFENQLLSGNTEEILKEVRETDKKAFDTIVDEYLPTLAKVDKEAYFHVVGNLNKRLIMEMVQEAKDTDNEELQQAALLVNQFIFGTSKFTAPSLRVAKEDNSTGEASKVEEERLAFVRERFEIARDDVQTKIDNTLRATISQYIDSKGTMSSYVKKNAINDAMSILSKSIVSDPATVKNLDNLWRASLNSKFSKESLSKIQSFYLSRAKSNLKNAIVKARAEALKDLPPAKRQENDEEETPSTRRNIATGRPSQHSKGKNVIQKGESVTDFFMRD